MLLQNIKTIPNKLGVCRYSTTSIVLARRWKDKYAKDYESEFHNPVREVAGMKVGIDIVKFRFSLHVKFLGPGRFVGVTGFIVFSQNFFPYV